MIGRYTTADGCSPHVRARIGIAVRSAARERAYVRDARRALDSLTPLIARAYDTHSRYAGPIAIAIRMAAEQAERTRAEAIALAREYRLIRAE